VPLPETVYEHSDPCAIAERWGIRLPLAIGLVQMATLGRDVPFRIISGLRSPARQLELANEGKPTASIETSTHLSCPATGADIWPTIAVTNVVKARLGAEGVRAGLRWGGGSPVDPSTGIPSDWNHFDLGPRLP